MALECPRCGSTHTKFSNYSWRNKSKAIHHCKNCRRNWTVGARLRASPGEWKRRQPELSMADQASMSQVALKCPRCESTQTNFYGRSIQKMPKPVKFCKNCRHYWTVGGSLREKRQQKDSDEQTSVQGPESKAASKETTEVVQTKCTQLLIPSVEERQHLSLCLVKSDNYIAKDTSGQEETWQFEGSSEMASMGGSESNVASTECSKSLSPSADNHQPLSVWPEKFDSHIEKGSEGFPFNDEVMPNEEVHLSNGLKSVESPESSNVVENPSCVEKCNSSNDFCSIAKGAEKAHCFPVDVTTTTSRQQSPEPPLESGLPFIKSSFMWPKVESMEVFRSMPQQPHFNPLKEQDEHLREGEAIGLMLSFTKLVEATRKAHLEDSRTIFDMKLKALQILEEHGFSIQPIRSQLIKLLQIRESCGQLNGQLTTVTLEVNAELESVALLDMDIQMLKEKKKMKTLKVAELQRTSVQIEERIRAARSNFDELVAAPW